MNFSPNNAIILGDSFTDIESSGKAGLTTCFVQYGIGKLKKTKAHFNISRFDELLDILSTNPTTYF